MIYVVKVVARRGAMHGIILEVGVLVDEECGTQPQVSQQCMLATARERRIGNAKSASGVLVA